MGGLGQASSEDGDQSGHPPWGPSGLWAKSVPEAGSPSAPRSTGSSGRAEACKVPKHQLSEPVCLQSDFPSAASLSSRCSAHGLGMELGGWGEGCP